MASEPSGVDRKYLHGGGSRYIQENNDEYYTDGKYSTFCVVLYCLSLKTNFYKTILACKQYLDEFNLPDAYDVPGNDLPGSQTRTHTVNSVNNSDHAGDGPGSLDYDMDGSLMGYYPLVVSLNFAPDSLAPQKPSSLAPIGNQILINYFRNYNDLMVNASRCQDGCQNVKPIMSNTM